MNLMFYINKFICWPLTLYHINDLPANINGSGLDLPFRPTFFNKQRIINIFHVSKCIAPHFCKASWYFVYCLHLLYPVVFRIVPISPLLPYLNLLLCLFVQIVRSLLVGSNLCWGTVLHGLLVSCTHWEPQSWVIFLGMFVQQTALKDSVSLRSRGQAWRLIIERIIFPLQSEGQAGSLAAHYKRFGFPRLRVSGWRPEAQGTWGVSGSHVNGMLRLLAALWVAKSVVPDSAA